MSKMKAELPGEARGFNRLSEKTHGGLMKVQSNVRFSLTLRIAMHYCWQLVRSSLIALLVVAICFCGLFGVQMYRTARRLLPSEPDLADGMYSQLVLQNSSLSARVEPGEEGADENTDHREFLRKFRLDFPRKVTVAANRTDGSILCLTADLRDGWLILMTAAGSLILTDLIRMLYFLTKRKRLDKRVLAPIREMTEMAQTLSAANLSNRINVAGTKNELQDLAVVINSMLDRIEQSYNSQKQFVSSASHELRTPIAVIQGYADMLNRWGKDDPEVLQEGIDAIAQETRAMKELVESLLFLARHDNKTMMLEITAFDPCEVVEEVQRETAMVNPDDAFVMEQMDSMTLQADRGLVKQLLRILVDNAVKYSPPGGKITLGVKKTPDRCLLSVRDEGEGIDPDELPKIFDRFYRSESAKKSEHAGHGLGLSIARIIAVAHGGKIYVTSKKGMGTTFEVELPLQQTGAAPQASGQTA